MRANSNITVYRKKYDSVEKDFVWARIVIKNVSWFSGKHSTLSSSKYDRFTVRVFINELAQQFVESGLFGSGEEKLSFNSADFERTDKMKDSAGYYIFDENGRLDISEGDVVVRGDVAFDVPSLARESLPDYEVFNVVSITDNRTGTPYMRHYKIAGM